MPTGRTATDLLAADEARTIRALGSAALEKRSAQNSESYLDRPSMRLIDALGGSASASGARVNETTASTVATVTACVGILADMIAKLPLKVYQKTADGREEAVDHPANRLISIDPGCSATPYEFRQLLQTGVGFGGNGYARVYRDQFYQPAELEWLKPCDVYPDRVNRQIIYRVKGVRDVLTRADVLHVRTISSDGVCGLSPVRLMRESIGLSITQRHQAGKIYANGARFPGFIVTPTSLRPEQVKDFRDEWAKNQEGPENVGKTPVLWGGYDYKTVNGMSMQDAEFLESRKFEVEEICSFYRVAPVMLGRSSGGPSAWGTGIESLGDFFKTFSLDPWLVNWEQALNYTLLSEQEQDAGYYFKFNRRALLAVALQTQAKFLREMRDIAVYSVNDCRRYLEENDLPDNIGDNYALPFNGSGGRPQESNTPANQPANAA